MTIRIPFSLITLVKYVLAGALLCAECLVYGLSFIWISDMKTLFVVLYHRYVVGSSIEVADGVRRHPHYQKDLLTHVPGRGKTLYEVLKIAVSNNAGYIAHSTREFDTMKKLKSSDRFPTKVFKSTTIDKTYEEFSQDILNFGSGLRKVGLKHREGSQTGDNKGSNPRNRLLIFEDTCSEWTVAAHACFSQSLQVVTAYATLGVDNVIGIIKLDTFLKNMDGDLPSLKIIIISMHEFDKIANGSPSTWIETMRNQAKAKGLTLATFDDLIKLGKETMSPPTPPTPKDIAVIMYTSGSTGKPKGVVMTHGNLVASLSSMLVDVTFKEHGKEVYISYLPLAHVLALVTELCVFMVGGKICYADPRTLVGALKQFRPTAFCGVPKIFDNISKGITKKVAKLPFTMQFIFDIAVTCKVKMASTIGIKTLLLDSFFFNRFRKSLGGRVNKVISGGGALNVDTQQLCSALLCVQIVQGYALTETCCGGCMQGVGEDFRPRCVGKPMASIEIKLLSTPDINDANGSAYLSTDRIAVDGRLIKGRGEVLIRGPSVSSMGYLNNRKKTVAVFDKEGWFHTGDIGQFTADGALMIIDRKKNLVKLKGGEYVALEAMETAFNSSPVIRGTCVFANSDIDYPAVLVNTTSETLQSVANKAGVKSNGVNKDLATNDAVQKAFIKALLQEGTKARLTPLEMKIKNIAIVFEEEWIQGNGLTASGKLDRQKIASTLHKDIVDDLLKRAGA
eukprot:g1308.t1